MDAKCYILVPASFRWHIHHHRYLHWVSWQDLCRVSPQPHSYPPHRSEMPDRIFNITNQDEVKKHNHYGILNCSKL